jgi:endonuclease YncB( thermonuclease family)
MSFTLIPGTFKPDTGIPDGDTVRFAPDNSMLLFTLNRQGRPPRFNQDNQTVSLRYEGIDALEKQARTPESSDATAQNLALLGITDTVRETRGYILSNQIDPNGRAIAFIFTEELDDGETEGDSFFLKPNRLKKSLNYQLIEEGNAYPLFYDTLFFDLRQEFTDAVQAAKKANKGIWQDDATTQGITWKGSKSLKTIPPIFPKLWRRLDGYTKDLDFQANSATLDNFLSYLDFKKPERVLIISESRFTGFDNLVEIEDNRLRLLYSPEDLVFMS